MVYENPTDEVLSSADFITLFDPRVPGWEKDVLDLWSHAIVDFGPEVEITPDLFNPACPVEIPVDSTNPQDVERWFRRINAVLK